MYYYNKIMKYGNLMNLWNLLFQISKYFNIDLGDNIGIDDRRPSPPHTPRSLNSELEQLSLTYPLFSEDEKDLRSDLQKYSVNDPKLRYKPKIFFKIMNNLNTVYRICFDTNGDISYQNITKVSQGNYDIQWDKKIGADTCSSLEELRLHETRSMNIGLKLLNSSDVSK